MDGGPTFEILDFTEFKLTTGTSEECIANLVAKSATFPVLLYILIIKH